MKKTMPSSVHQKRLETPIDADAASVSRSRIAETVNSVMSPTPSERMCWCLVSDMLAPPCVPRSLQANSMQSSRVQTNDKMCLGLGVGDALPDDEFVRDDLRFRLAVFLAPNGSA